MPEPLEKRHDPTWWVLFWSRVEARWPSRTERGAVPRGERGCGAVKRRRSERGELHCGAGGELFSG